MLSSFWSQGPNSSVRDKVDCLRHLAKKLGDWISGDEEAVKKALVKAIQDALQEYKNTRDAIIEGVRGSQDPVEMSQEGGVLAMASWGAQRFLQVVRGVTAENLVAPNLTNKEMDFRQAFGDVTEENVVPVLLYIREDIRNGWGSQRIARRTSLNTLIVDNVAALYLKGDLTTKTRLEACFGPSQGFFRNNAQYAFELYLMTIARLDEIGYSARHLARLPGAR